MPRDGIILIHGGAGDWNKDRLDKALKFLNFVIEEAYEILIKKGAVESVLYAISMLENSEIFNAGRGSVLNLLGEVEVDASIMVGDGSAGAVAAVKNVRNPIYLADFVRKNLDHILLTGKTAEFLARKNNLLVSMKSLITSEREIQWKRAIKILLNYIEGKSIDIANEKFEKIRQYIFRRYPKLISFIKRYHEIIREIRDANKYGGETVGAVAYDGKTLVAATSTGGLFLKLPGRIGDTPILGAGTFADNKVGAFSATGVGEQIMKNVLTFNIALLTKEYGIRSALEHALAQKKSISAGVIGLGFDGTWEIVHTTPHMPCAVNDYGKKIIKAVWKRIG